MAELLGPFGSLANGQVVSSNGSTIIVQNGNNANNGSCLPCDDGTVCTVGQSNGSRLDLGKFKTTNNTLRLNVNTTLSESAAEDKNIVFFVPLYIHTWEMFTRLVDYFGASLLGGYASGAEESDGSLINGIDAGLLLGSFNVSGLNGGALLAKATVQYNSAAYPQLDGITITGFFLPPDPSDSVEADAVYSPLCDFCTSSNNGNFTTHAYTASLPVSGRQGVVIFVPGATGGAIFTLDLCFASNGFPNHEQSTWADQEG